MRCRLGCVLLGLSLCWGGLSSVDAANPLNTVTGLVQNQDLRRVPQATVEIKDQDGTIVATGVTNDAGEFAIPLPERGTYSVSAVRET